MKTMCVRIVVLAIGIALLRSAAGFASFECFPCTQCDGKYCFHYNSMGQLIGTIGNTCCTGGTV